MIQYLIASNGKYAGKLEGTAEEILTQTPSNYNLTILPPPRETDYWNGTNWVAIGSAPAYYFVYDYDKKEWKDNRDLTQTKKEKWESVKLERNKVEFGGFKFRDKNFDSDYISQGRILAAIVFGQPTTWTLADDGTMDLDSEGLQALGVALTMHVNAQHERGRIARNLINQAETVEEVDAVIF